MLLVMLCLLPVEMHNAIGGLVGSKSSMTTTITDSYYSGTVDEGSGNTTDAGTSKTLDGVKSFDSGCILVQVTGWTVNNWAGMDSSTVLPTLRSSITGNILCGQSRDHKPCPLAN